MTSFSVRPWRHYWKDRDVIFGQIVTSNSVFVAVTISNGEWSVVPGLAISEFAREKMKATAEELLQEKAEAEEVCKEWFGAQIIEIMLAERFGDNSTTCDP